MKSTRRGLSLIEVILVILILGILASFAAPRFGDSVRLVKLQSAANQMAAHIDYVRNVAMNESRTATFSCDNDLGTYSGDVDFPDQPGTSLQVDVRAQHDPAFSLSADFDSASSLEFDFEGMPYVGGTPMAAGSISISDGEAVFVIRIANGTGRTSVSRSTTVTAPTEQAAETSPSLLESSL